jgi:predicted DNA-binding ribbon-helix-helix protein
MEVSLSHSSIKKRSLAIEGRKTSISLENEFWDELKKIAQRRGVSVASLIGSIDRTQRGANLSSKIRVFVLEAHLPILKSSATK